VFEETPGLTTSLKNEIREQIEAKVQDYCQLADEMPQRARDILQQHGYFKALVYDPTWKQVGGSHNRSNASEPNAFSEDRLPFRTNEDTKTVDVIFEFPHPK